MSDDVEVAGQAVFELFGACAAAPDDEAVGRAGDRALAELDALLARRAETPRPPTADR